jgi:RNA polymerase subunit RPABC4/transcription elongation factor Spt4
MIGWCIRCMGWVETATGMCPVCGATAAGKNLSKKTANLPIKPGFYWALWLTAATGTHEGDQLTPAQHWEVVEVWENFVGDPCEADVAEKFGVSVPGVRESQWLENFKWGSEVLRP